MSKNNLFINKTNSISPFNSRIISSENYVKKNTLISNEGVLIYGNSSNLLLKADSSVKPGESGPILQFYGKGSSNATVGINLDTFESNNSNGRYNGNNPATQILAIDNGQYSNDLVFLTSDPSTNANNLSQAQKRLKIKGNGDTTIYKNLDVIGNLYINNLVEIYQNCIVKNDLSVEGNSEFGKNIKVNGKSTFVENGLFESNLYVNKESYFGDTGHFNSNLVVFNDLYVGGTGNFNNDVNIAGNLGVTGNSTFGGTGNFNSNVNIAGNLGVTGSSTFGGTGNFNSDVNIAGNLGVTGTSTFGGTGTFNSDLIVNGNLTVNGSFTSISILEMVYPVGSIYMNYNNSANPSSLLSWSSSTWIQIPGGYTLVSYYNSSGDSNFSNLGATGGNTMTQNHSHQWYEVNSSSSYTIDTTPASSGFGIYNSTGSSITINNDELTQSAFTSTNVLNSTTNSNYSPYLVVSMWKRTA